ncbi:MAG: UPF0104 family protein [Limnospira sp.]
MKSCLRWAVFGITLFFLGAALRQHWREVAEIQITGASWAILGVALAVTLMAHIWSGWVWLLILREFKLPADARISPSWGLRVYLKTNIAKYIPGNVWHFYGRVVAVKDGGISLGVATLSVVLEPLLMAAAALAIAIVSVPGPHRGLQVLLLTAVLAGVHPRILNPVVGYLGRLKSKSQDPSPSPGVRLHRYPLKPFLGELGFVGLRGAGFLLTLVALGYWNWGEVPFIFGAFSFAWLLGLVVPVAPGGLGVFEATALALLERHISPGIVLGAIACYRVVSILAETAGAGLASWDERWRGGRS